MTDNINIHQRLASAMKAVSYIQKEHKKGMQYSTVSHDAVTAKVRPALLEAGIVYYPVRCDHQHNGNRAECSMTVRFVNVDQPDDYFDVPTFGYGIDGQDKGPGKAMSYAVKYALLKALGLETGDDPDTDADTPKHKPDVPHFDPKAFAERMSREMAQARTLPDLREKFGEVWSHRDQMPEMLLTALTATKDRRRKELEGPDPAMQAPPQNDHIAGGFDA